MEKEEAHKGPKCSEGQSIPEVMGTAADRRVGEDWRRAGQKGPSIPTGTAVLAHMGSTFAS